MFTFLNSSSFWVLASSSCVPSMGRLAWREKTGKERRLRPAVSGLQVPVTLVSQVVCVSSRDSPPRQTEGRPRDPASCCTPTQPLGRLRCCGEPSFLHHSDREQEVLHVPQIPCAAQNVRPALALQPLPRGGCITATGLCLWPLISQSLHPQLPVLS